MAEMWANVMKATMASQRKEPVDPVLWKPYYEFLIKVYKEAIATGKNVVLTFAMLDCFGEMSWIKEQIFGIKFFVVDVDMENIIKRACVRNKGFVEASGTTLEEMWKTDMMKETREKYGEEYTYEGYCKATEEEMSGMVLCPHKEPFAGITFIKNNDLENFEGVKALNKALSLSWEPVDAEAINAVNMKRMENLNVDAEMEGWKQ